PAMIRSASKNYRDVAVIVSPDSYRRVLDEMRANNCALTLATRARLARQAFVRTALYDTHIFSYLGTHLPGESADAQTLSADPSAIVEAMKAFHSLTLEFINQLPSDAETAESADEPAEEFPDAVSLSLSKLNDLRYGENPHQPAALYGIEDEG